MGFAVPGNAAMDKRSGSVRRPHSGVMVEGKPGADGTRTLPRVITSLLVHTLMVFTQVSASVLVLNAPWSTIATPVVAGLVSTTVHFLAVASFTT